MDYRDVTEAHLQQLYQKALSLMTRRRGADDPPPHADEIPPIVCRTIFHATMARSVYFLIRDQEDDTLVFQHVEGPSGALGRAVRHSQFIEEIRIRSRMDPMLTGGPEDIPLLLPLGNESESNSYVLIIGPHTPAVGTEQGKLLVGFLDDAAHHLWTVIALQKNRLHQASHEAAHGPIGGRRRVDDFLSLLLRALRVEVPFEGGSIFRTAAGEKKPKLKFAATIGTLRIPLKGEAMLDISDDSGSPSSSLDPKERSRRMRLAWESALRTQEPYRSLKQTGLNVPISSPDGGLIGMLHALGRQRHSDRGTGPYFTPWDIEIFKAAAEQAAIISLLSAEEQRTELLQHVTHEIRQPVITIRNNIDSLRRRPHDEAQFKQKYADIQLEVELLLSLASNLDVLFGAPRTESSHSDSVEVEPILAAIVRSMEPELRERGISQSQVEVDVRAFPRIRMPSADLNQIFSNLFRNAILYSRPGSPSSFHVRIVSSVRNQRTVIHFRDWGIGVAEADRERIFERGIRGSNVERIQVRGSGLGLASCRQLMGEHGGTIAVTNLNKPTELTLEFAPAKVDLS